MLRLRKAIVDFFVEVFKELSILEEDLKGGGVNGIVKQYNQHTNKAGKWGVGEYFIRMEALGGYEITSTSQFREKCDQCNKEICCTVDCEVYEWKSLELEQKRACRNCKFKSECLGVMDKFDEVYVEFDQEEIKVRYKNRKYTTDDIEEMGTCTLKTLLRVKYLNEVYKRYGNHKYLFKTCKKENELLVKWKGELYSFPVDFTQRQVLAAVWRELDGYKVNKDKNVNEDTEKEKEKAMA